MEREREQYMNALLKEVISSPYGGEKYKVQTVFIGGGTPSVLQGKDLEKILDGFKETFPYMANEDREWTIEVNPCSVTRYKLSEYKQMGVNRLCFGLQSAIDDELKRLGRVHTKEEFLHTYRQAREEGFDNINIDLLAALPGQTLNSYKESLEFIVELEPEHISSYSLIVEEGTLFHQWYQDGKGLPDEEVEREMYVYTEQYLKTKGYNRYEISNYAKEGRECRHNLVYWQRGEYLGFGLGASSLMEETRFQNKISMDQYKEDPGKKENIKKLPLKEQMEETMFLGLRMEKGVSRIRFYERFAVDLKEIYENSLNKLEQGGFIKWRGDFLVLTKRGVDVSNQVLAQFLFD